MLGGITCGSMGVLTGAGDKEEREMSESKTDTINKQAIRLTVLGAAVGGAAGFLLSLYDASHSMTMFFAYGMDVTASMAFMGGLIGANCVPSHGV